MTQLKPGKYQHYKGGLYQALGVALHTETREKMVLYQALYECPELAEEYGPKPFFVRPYASFMEKVRVSGEEKTRFELVE